MTIQTTRGLLHGARAIWNRALFATVLITSAATAQQNPPSLLITSPANNAVLNPGGTLTLTITSSPSGTAFSQIAIIGPGFLGFNVIAPASLPTQFSLPIPPDADCRKYTVTVDGIPASGGDATPGQLQIDVERSDAAVALSASLSSLTFQSQGEQTSIKFAATFFDTSVIDVTESTLMSYASSNNGVATVNASGTVNAVAPGNASVTATYGQGATSFPLSIPVIVLPPRLIASPASLSFAAQAAGTNSAPQQVTLTNTSTGPINTIVASAVGDFSETDTCAASLPLAVGSSCTVSVTFSPSGTGSRTGSLEVANSANIVPISIPLTGTGTAAPPPPSITSLSPTSGAVGTSVTITGTNFGATQGTSTLVFNGTAATPTSWSATSIVAPAPSGATTGNVVVTVGGVASNGVSFTVSSGGGGPITYVQGNSVTPFTWQTASMTLAYAAAQTAGNLNVVVVSAFNQYNPSATINSVTDTRGNTYVLAAGPTVLAGFGMQAIYYAKNISAAAPGANAVTVTFGTPADQPETRIVEYSGLDTVNPLDVSIANAGYACFDCGQNQDLSTSGPVTTTNANDLLVGANVVDYISGEFTTEPGPGFTGRLAPNTGDILEDEVVSVTGSYSATAPLYTDGFFVMQMVAFRSATH